MLWSWRQSNRGEQRRQQQGGDRSDDETGTDAGHSQPASGETESGSRATWVHWTTQSSRRRADPRRRYLRCRKSIVGSKAFLATETEALRNGFLLNAATATTLREE